MNKETKGNERKDFLDKYKIENKPKRSIKNKPKKHEKLKQYVANGMIVTLLFTGAIVGPAAIAKKEEIANDTIIRVKNNLSKASGENVNNIKLTYRATSSDADDKEYIVIIGEEEYRLNVADDNALNSDNIIGDKAYKIIEKAMEVTDKTIIDVYLTNKEIKEELRECEGFYIDDSGIYTTEEAFFRGIIKRARKLEEER